MIKLRDDNRARREAKEKEEREKLGLEPKVKKEINKQTNSLLAVKLQ